jgi:ABC-type uncharacterized transport system substrate-binding protein
MTWALQQVDIIVTHGTPGVQAAQRASSTIPIVMAFAGDPVGLGLVDSLARPGGNVTGLTTLAPELAPKRLQLLREAAPAIRRIGVLHDPADPGRVLALGETESAGRTLGLDVLPLELREPSYLGALLEGAVSAGVDALVVLQGGLVASQTGGLIDLVKQHRLPAMYESEQFAAAGGLMFYGPNFTDLYRRAASYVDQILRGARPTDLPIQRPTAFEFVVNLKAAEALALTIPPSVLQQTTLVIQ